MYLLLGCQFWFLEVVRARVGANVDCPTCYCGCGVHALEDSPPTLQRPARSCFVRSIRLSDWEPLVQKGLLPSSDVRLNWGDLTRLQLLRALHHSGIIVASLASITAQWSWPRTQTKLIVKELNAPIFTSERAIANAPTHRPTSRPRTRKRLQRNMIMVVGKCAHS